MDTSHRLSVAILILLGTLSRAIAADSPTIHFEIPAGDAQQMLLQFVAQANIEMLYSSDDVRGVVTHAVSGDFTIPEALSKMIEGTGLEMSFEQDYTFASIKPSKQRSQQPDRRRLRERERREGSADPEDHNARDRPLQQVVVTGSLIRGLGVQAITSPVMRVERDSVQRARYGTLQDVLQTIPLNMHAAQSESFDSAGNFGRGVAANLHGLGAGATLVLIDGHRQPFSGNDGDYVDISGIPWAAVERVEILPDGASALYGSDAIAGVVNVIVRKDRRANETTGRIGVTPDGASERLISQLGAFDWSSGHGTFAYQYSERDQLSAADRIYAESSDKRPLGGSDLRSIRSSPGNILNPQTLLPAYAIADGDGRALSMGDLTAGSVNLQDRNQTLDLLPHRLSHSAYASASQTVGSAEIFFDGRFHWREVHQDSYAFSQNLAIPTSNPFARVLNPFPSSPVVIVAYSFLDDLGPIVLKANVRDLVGTAGVRTMLSDTWHAELSATHGQERTDFSADGQVDFQRYLAAIADPNPTTALDIFGRTTSASTLASIRSAQPGFSVSNLSSVTAVADGPLFSAEHASAKLAVGAEWRQEQLRRSTPSAGDFGRTVASTFAELAVPISHDPNSILSIPRLELSASARWERYSDFGVSLNPKLGFRWIPWRSVKVRASWGTSFRSPKLVDIYDAASRFAAQISLADPRSPSGRSVVLLYGGPNLDLKEERANTWTAGVDVAPSAIDGMHLSLTYYSVNYLDRVAAPPTTDILLNESQWSSVIDRTPSQATIEAVCRSPAYRGNVPLCLSTPVAAVIDGRLRNLSSTRVQGVDLAAEHSTASRFGAFKFNARASYMLRFDQRAVDSAPATDVLDTIGNPLAFRARSDTSWFQHGADLQGWGVSVGIDYTGAYRDGNRNRRVAAFKSFDLAFGYRTRTGTVPYSGLDIWLSASNLFNADPSFIDRESGYDVLNGDPFGRTATFQVRKEW